MSKEIRLLIQERLKGFKPGIIQSDVDSFIFDTPTMLKVEELSKEFDMGLVIEVMQNKHYFANMTIDSIPAKREAEVYRDEYSVDNISSREDIFNLSKEMAALFDELVDTSTPGQHLVKDVDEWIRRIDSMKKKYGYRPFTLMYDNLHGVRKLMWDEGLDEATAVNEFANRQEKEMNRLLAERVHRDNQVKGRLSQYDRIKSIMQEFDPGQRFFIDEKAFIPPESAFKDIQTRALVDAVETNFKAKVRPGNMIVSDFHIGMGLAPLGSRDSGGYGYDISTNGGRHKKVVTGKAGNKFPVPKRRGVK